MDIFEIGIFLFIGVPLAILFLIILFSMGIFFVVVFAVLFPFLAWLFVA
jgi:hypothetical protein